MLLGKFSWVLWFLRHQIINRDTIGLLFMLLLFKFIGESDSGFPRYKYVKVFIYPIIIAERLVFP